MSDRARASQRERDKHCRDGECQVVKEDERLREREGAESTCRRESSHWTQKRHAMNIAREPEPLLYTRHLSVPVNERSAPQLFSTYCVVVVAW